MVSLDDPMAIRKADEHGMLEFYMRWADAARDAIQRARAIELPTELRTRKGVIRYGQPEALAIAGMGGSVIGGDILRDILQDEVSVPIEVWRDYGLPSWLGPGHMVVAISYSGNTEETLVAFSEALKRGCMVIAITSGGYLASLCRKTGVPLLEVPGGRVTRMSFPYLFFPLLVFLERSGLARGLCDLAERAAGLLSSMAKDLGPETPTEENEAKRLASRLVGTVPLVYGFGWLKAVAYRLKTQFNENSKVPSFSNWFPPMNHHEIVGWEAEEELLRVFSVVLLRSRGEPPEIRRRIELTKEIALERASNLLEIWARGSSKLEEAISALYIGDIASLYLAFARGVDPYRTESISALKRGMAELGIADKVEKEIEGLAIG